MVSLGWLASHYHHNAITFKEQRDKATVRAETAETVSNSVVTAMNLINDISRATQECKRPNFPRQVRSALSTSGRRLKAISVLSSLFLLPLLTACENTRTVYVPAPVVPISADLTADTPIPEWRFRSRGRLVWS